MSLLTVGFTSFVLASIVLLAAAPFVASWVARFTTTEGPEEAR